MNRFHPAMFALALVLLAGAPPADAQGKRQASASSAADSIVALEKAVARDSSKFDNLYRLGVMYLDHDRVEDAVQVLTRANRVRPKDVRALVNLGAAHDAAGNAAAAQERYRSALALSPDDSIAVCRLASSLYAEGKHTESVDLLRRTIAGKPRSYCAYFTLGIAFADAGIYREAIRMWRKVVEIAPDSPEAISAKESIEVLEKFVNIR